MNKIYLSITLLFIWATVQSQTPWIQKGIDIDGETAFDQSGNSVSMSADGNTVAIGAYKNDDAGSEAGQVRIYEWNGSAWTQKGSDIDGEAAGDRSGVSVSMNSDGNSIAIGSDQNDGSGADAGHVRVYEWNGSSWSQKGADLDGEMANDKSGTSVSLSSDGNTVAIGAPFNDGAGADAGHARVYQWNGTAWIQKGIDIDGEATQDQSGFSVSISSNGNILAIGAPQNDGAGSNAGQVRVYEWDGTSWLQLGVDLDGETADDASGLALSLNSEGTILAIGATGNNEAGFLSGHTRIYQWLDNGWIQKGTDIDGEAPGDNSGYSVSISSDGNTVAIGARLNNNTQTASGHVRVYYWYNDSAWVQKGDDIDGEATDDQSGWSVSLEANGNTLAIGAVANSDAGMWAGHVRCYELTLPSVGLAENDEQIHARVYPNPTAGNYTIDLGEATNPTTIRLTDFLGKEIQTEIHFGNGSQLIKWVLNEPAGVYFLTIDTGNAQEVIRLVKE